MQMIEVHFRVKTERDGLSRSKNMADFMRSTASSSMLKQKPRTGKLHLAAEVRKRHGKISVIKRKKICAKRR